MKSTEKMKHRLRPVLFYGLLIIAVTACKDDDPIPAEATLEFSSDQLVDGVYVGVIGATDDKGKLTIHLEGSVPAGIKSFHIIRNYSDEGGLNSLPIAEYNELKDQQEIDLDVTYAVQSSDVQTDTEIKAVLVDNRDRELTLHLAHVEAYWPLDLTSGIVLDSDTEAGVENYTHYLTVLKMGSDPTGAPTIDVQSANMVSVEASNGYSKVHLIYDYDVTLKQSGPTGSYLCSPHHAATSNPGLVDFFTVKNHTITKVITYSALTSDESNQLENIGANNVALLITLFDKYQPGGTTERVTFNGAQGDQAFVLFKTYEGKIGLIKDYQLNEGSDASIQFDLWMMR